jgi:hypothetical protein
MPSYSRVARILIALSVPALAVAAPKHGKKQPPPTNAGSDAGSAAGSDAGSAAVAPTPEASAGSGSAAGEPTKVEATKAEATNAKNEPDVDSLRQEYLSLRDELFKSRARANAVASALYSTRIQIRFAWTSGRYYGVNKAQVRLDGATVYEDAGGAIAGDDGVRFDGYVAPGRHLVTFHVEATGKDDDSFTESTESQIVVKAVAQKDLVVAAKAHDSGDIAYAWKKSEHGSYGIGIDVSVKAAAPVVDKGKK